MLRELYGAFDAKWHICDLWSSHHQWIVKGPWMTFPEKMLQIAWGLLKLLHHSFCKHLMDFPSLSYPAFNSHWQYSRLTYLASVTHKGCMLLSWTDMVIWQVDIWCRPAMGAPRNKLPPICGTFSQTDSQGLHLCTSCWHVPPQTSDWHPYLWGTNLLITMFLHSATSILILQPSKLILHRPIQACMLSGIWSYGLALQMCLVSCKKWLHQKLIEHLK
jgi:hypothetical protein